MVSRAGSDRRRFLAGAAVFVGSRVVTSGCAGTPTASEPPPQDRVGTVSLNHGHEAIVTAARLGAAAGFTLEIQGSSAHGHALELTADDVARIQRGEMVSVLSAAGWEDKHDHRVTFNGDRPAAR
jgi:hypothetical protein